MCSAGAMMNVFSRLFLAILLGLISIPASAGAIEISHREESLLAESSQSNSQEQTELARTEIVTVEADFASDPDVERAYSAAASVAEAMETDAEVQGSASAPIKTLVEVSNPDLRQSSRARAAFQKLKLRFRAAHTKSFQLAQSTTAKMASIVANPIAPIRSVIKSAKNNTYKTTLFVIKFVSATSAAAVSIVAVNGLPPTNFEYIEMIARSVPTGLMSAMMVAYADLYTGFIIKPAFFAKYVDNSKWFTSIVRAVQKPFRKDQNFKEFPLKLGLYMDQLIKSLSLEFPFVYISTMFASSISAANESILHILENAFNGGAGQMFFDQVGAIISESLSDKVKAQYPEGSPEREKKLSRIKRFRDAGMVSNSIFQVWAVLLSANGYSAATTAVQAYAITGFLARIAVIPLENKILRTAKANAAAEKCRLILRGDRNGQSEASR